MTSALSVRHVSKRFGGNVAVDDVSFEIATGTLTALIGPNGAGKTTLFNIITNLMPASAGDVLFFGRSTLGMAVEDVASVGLIRTFQSARVFPGMTVLENVAVGAHRLLRVNTVQQMLSTSRARREERLIYQRSETLLELIGLASERHRPAAELPMGAQKLLDVIRAVMAAPRLLLLDEPAAGLDDTETRELMSTLTAIRESGIALLMVEHKMDLVMGLADQIVVLDAGRTVAVGTAEEIQGNRAVVEAYLGRGGPERC